MNAYTVGVRELKARLSYYVREMKAGRTITVTERGKAVGYLMPAKTNLDDRLEAMRDAGLLSWSGKRPKLSRPTVRLKGGRSLTDIISENRE